MMIWLRRWRVLCYLTTLQLTCLLSIALSKMDAPHAATMQYLTVAKQLKSLISAVLAYTSPESVTMLQSALEGVTTPSSLPDITSEMYLLAELVLEQQGLNCHQGLPQLEGSSKAGYSVLLMIADSLHIPFTAGYTFLTMHVEFYRHLICNSIALMCTARDLLVQALLWSINDANSISLLSVASHTDIPQLGRAAYDHTISHFQGVLSCDANGLAMLPRNHLISILADDNLQVDSEADVFLAVLSWFQQHASMQTSGSQQGSGLKSLTTMAAVTNNCHNQKIDGTSFVRVCQACVRQGMLTHTDLEKLDSNEQVMSCEEAGKMVALWYIRMMFDTPAEQPCKLRNRLARSPS